MTLRARAEQIAREECDMNFGAHGENRLAHAGAMSASIESALRLVAEREAELRELVHVACGKPYYNDLGRKPIGCCNNRLTRDEITLAEFERLHPRKETKG